jgi:hypothetical protein
MAVVEAMWEGRGVTWWRVAVVAGELLDCRLEERAGGEGGVQNMIARGRVAFAEEEVVDGLAVLTSLAVGWFTCE